MAHTIDISYFNSMIIKPKQDLVIYGPVSEEEGIPAFANGVANELISNWHVEESRIKGGFNEDSMGYGVKAYITDEKYALNHRPNTMIYSGIFNSRTDTNQSNEFNSSEPITRSVDPSDGSIQKLYAEDTNLIIFQENKVSSALIDKDAVFTAEGLGLTTSGVKVIGQIVPYLGEYGISKNPESFAVYGFRKYFTDKSRGAVLRLSRDGITEISSYGMRSFFRDEFKKANKAYGMFDIHSKTYILSLSLDKDYDYNNQTYSNDSFGNSIVVPQTNYKTLSFDDKVNGWSSFYTFDPTFGGSLAGKFYTWNTGDLYEHYSNENKNTFYGNFNPSTVSIVSNQNPSLSKNYKSVNYEGTKNWKVIELTSPGDDDNSYKSYPIVGNITGRYFGAYDGSLQYAGFTPLQKKYYGHIIINNQYVNSSGEKVTNMSGVNGLEDTGIKGFFTEATFEHEPVNNDKKSTKTNHAELFSVGFNYEQSLY